MQLRYDESNNALYTSFLMYLPLTSSGVVCILSLRGAAEQYPFTTRLRVLKVKKRTSALGDPRYGTCFGLVAALPPLFSLCLAYVSHCSQPYQATEPGKAGNGDAC
jgi:hypothetical protein